MSYFVLREVVAKPPASQKWGQPEASPVAEVPRLLDTLPQASLLPGAQKTA